MSQKMTQDVAMIGSERSVRHAAATRCRERISNALRGATVAFYDMAMGLLEAYEQEYHKEWGFESFKAYVEAELDMKFRAAYYMVEIARTVRKHGLDANRVQQIGWTKMREITTALEERPEEQERYLHMAESMSARELKKAMHSEVTPGDAQKVKPSIMRLSLKFEGDDAGILSEALAMAYADIGREDVNQALSHIAGEWLMARGGGANASTLEQWQAFIEKTFGVRLLRSEREETIDTVLDEAFTPKDEEAIDSQLSGDDALDELLK